MQISKPRNSSPHTRFQASTKMQLRGSWNTWIHSTFWLQNREHSCVCNILSIWSQTAPKYLLLKTGKKYQSTAILGRLTQLISDGEWTKVQTTVSLSHDHPWCWQWCNPCLWIPSHTPSFWFSKIQTHKWITAWDTGGSLQDAYWSFNFPFAFLEFCSNSLNKMGTELRAFFAVNPSLLCFLSSVWEEPWDMFV